MSSTAIPIVSTIAIHTAAALVSALILLVVFYNFYRSVNKGLSSSSRHQQMTRIFTAALTAVLPTAVASGFAGVELPAVPLAVAGLLSVGWAVTFPLLFHLTNRKVSPDYDNQMDIATGLYLFSILSALVIAGATADVAGIIFRLAAAAIETAAGIIIIAQTVYFRLYHSCVDTNGMKIIRDTNYNEILEFSRSFPAIYTLVTVIVLILFASAIFAANLLCASSAFLPVPLTIMILAAVSMTVMVFKGKRSPARRNGIFSLYLTVKDYVETNRRYASEREATMKSLKVKTLGKPWSGPTSIVLVIGESASRDYMSAFTTMERDSTPWLREQIETDSKHFIPFPNTYASAMHTVAVLEKSLTEFNQYNDKNFYTSASIVDIARAAGYRIHWYSNQGHLGAADTPVTLVAETSDVARWTKQKLNTVQFDMSLLDFLDEVNPEVNNLIVLHLKGSHFNFLNRYPAEATVWGEPGVQDNIPNYLNSLRYTDSFLHKVFDTCRERFNMQAMLYFSDHGTIPSRHRTPGFDGFGHVRIPMFVYLGDEYQHCHPEPTAALRQNSRRYSTNDLMYDMMCGLIDIESPAYDPTSSLADRRYRFTRDMLFTFDGSIRIADDPDDKGRE